MRQVIYVDSLIFLNTVVTFLLLLAVRQFSGVKTSEKRLLLASLLGGASSLVIFIPRMGALFSAAYKAAVCGTIVFVAFFAKDGKKYLKCTGIFVFLTFLYAGAMCFLSQISGGVSYRNGVGYVGFGVWQMIVVSGVLYLLLRLLKKRFCVAEEAFRYEITLYCNGKSVSGKAYYDSGNFVCDCYTGRPVVIVSEAWIAPVLTEREAYALRRWGGLSADGTEALPWMRLIPVKTIAGNRLLPAFTGDAAVVRNADRYCRVEAPSVAVACAAFESAGCVALINGKFFE